MERSLRSSIAAAVLLFVLLGQGFVSAQQCPDGYFDLDDHCFHFVTEPLDWQSAEANCQALGGHLAVLNDCRVFGDIVKRINAQGLAGNHFFIGATDLAEEGNWLWITGESVEMGVPFWGLFSGEPAPSGGDARNCLFLDLSSRHYFIDGICTAKVGSICQTDPVPAYVDELHE